MGEFCYTRGVERLAEMALAAEMQVLESRVVELAAEFRSAQQREAEERRALETAQRQAAAAGIALQLVVNVAEAIQQRINRQISQVVSKCLRAVFGDNAYQFQILTEQKRGKGEMRFVFTRDGLEVDPLTAAGGGVVDVAAFGLRLAALLLQRPARRRLLVLDEPFRFVSAEYQPAVGELLEAVANELDVQIVMCTHVAGLADLGQVVEIRGHV